MTEVSGRGALAGREDPERQEERRPARLDVRLPAAPATVGRARAAVREFATAHGVQGDELGSLLLAVSEAVTNAVVHAFVDREPGTVRVIVRPGVDELVVRVLDDGRGMQPRPDSPGLRIGLATIGQVCRSMDIRSAPGGGTEVRMTLVAPGVRGLPEPDPVASGERLRVLLEIERLSSLSAWPEDGVSALVDLLCPSLVDVCAIDVLDEDGTPRRLAGAVAGDPELTRWLTTRAPQLRFQESPTYTALDEAIPALAEVTDELLRAEALDEEDLARLRALPSRWWTVLPLRQGRQVHGLLHIAFSESRGPLGAEDVAFFELVAERSSRALANAQLVSELARTRQRLERILNALSEAVTVHDEAGHIVYANEAAARLMGAGSPDELLASTPGDLVGRFRLQHEDGRPVGSDELPGRRLLGGRSASPLLARAVHRATGRQGWFLTKATVLDDERPLAVNIIEDVTEAKRAERRQRFLARAGGLLVGIAPPDMPQRLAELAVEELADWCLISAFDGRGRLGRIAIAHRDPEKVALVREMDRRWPLDPRAPSPLADMLAGGPALLVSKLSDEVLERWAHDDEHLRLLREVGQSSLVIAPLRTGGETLGALHLVTAESGHSFDESDREFAAVVAERVAAALVVSRRTAAERREQTARERERFALLAALAEVGDGRLALDDAAKRMCELFVPPFADLCVIDVVQQGGLRRLAVRMAGPDSDEREAELMARPLPRDTTPGVGAAVASGEPQLIDELDEDTLRAVSQGEDDLARLRKLELRSAVIVPLNARGRVLGALILAMTARSGRRQRRRDVEFLQMAAGRVALALDNAGLFLELETIEAQLSAALGELAEGVTIQTPSGNLIYANDAAARLLGYRTREEVLATPVQDYFERMEVTREDGSPLELPDLPGRRVLAGQDAQELVTRIIDRNSGEQRWRLTRSSAVRDRAGRVTMVVNVVSDLTAIKRAELSQRLLAESGDVLGSSLDHEQTLQAVADLCVPELADWCTVALPDERRQLRTVAVAHADPERVALARRAGERYPVALDEPGGSAQVFRSGVPALTNDITDAMLAQAARDEEQLELWRSLGMRAALVLPMTVRGRSVGVLSLVQAESRRVFSPEEVTVARELARRAGVAVENARLYTERSKIARTLQASLLPEELPALPGWRTATLYRPAGDENWVGGDFYEAIPVGEEWLLVVGDVTGRGAPAAALTALMRHTLRTAATLTGSPERALEKLNADLLARGALATAVVAQLGTGGAASASGAEAGIICAGHPLPVLVRGGVARHAGRFGSMLGAFAGERWQATGLPVQPGDVLVLYSDGVLDAIGAEERFGAERLLQTLHDATGAADAVARIERALADFVVTAHTDDTAVVAIERTAD